MVRLRVWVRVRARVLVDEQMFHSRTVFCFTPLLEVKPGHVCV
jgi:hypothetical protein